MDLLADGKELASEDIVKAAAEAGISERTVQNAKRNMSDTDSTFNFLISMVYTQLFNLLCEKADDVYGGRLPVHVRCLIDEAANIGQIPNFRKIFTVLLPCLSKS